MENVIEILNRSESAKALHTRFNELCVENNITGEEYDKAKQFFMMMMIAGNTDAMEAMAHQVYEDIRGDK